jgi:acyl-coenzyme A synthetase/AMP-(fatty) acid ligase
MRTPLVSMALRGEQPLDLEERGSEPPQGGNVLRTSGTTGSYKMILLTPAQEAEMLRRKQTITGMTRETLISASNFPLWGAAGHRWAGSAWLAGGAVLINTRAEHLALAHPGLTHAATIPQKVIAVLAAPTDAYPRNDALKLFVTAGTATQTQIEQAKARITPNVYNCLVGTELGLATCTRLVTAEDHRWHQVVPGRIIEIVDDADKPLPLGEVGRMRVNVAGGPTGYLGDEETTRAFFKDGFFYSGDLGMMRADGRVALQGRATDVINVQGHKISPVPLEDRLREALGIDGVCVFSMQNEAGEEELHVALETRAPISVERLLAELRSQRIAFSARKVHYLRMLPRNHMGKLMRPAIVAQVIAATRNRQGGADSEPDRSSST